MSTKAKDLDKRTGLPWGYEDLGLRLRNSIVMYKSKPVIITAIGMTQDSDPCLEATGEEGEIKIPLPSRHLDVRPFPLGYLPKTKSFISDSFAARLPVRRYKQGLDEENLIMPNNPMRPIEAWGKSELGMLGNCIDNRYPSLKEALTAVEQYTGVVKSFARKWAVSSKKDGNTLLIYRGREIGYIRDGQPVLQEEYSYLKEALDEDRAGTKRLKPSPVKAKDKLDYLGNIINCAEVNNV